MNDLHTRNGGHRVDFTDSEADAEDVLVTPGQIATWAAVVSLLAFLLVIVLALAAFHLIASIY